MFEYRAIQYDVSSGRIPRLDAIKRRLSLLRPYGLNTVFLYIESVVQCDSLPAVGCGNTPITKEYLCDLNAWCSAHGIRLAPILQIIGHQEELLALDSHQHLGELTPPRNQNATANNFLLDSDTAKRVLFAWLEELIPCFDSPFVHVGCDEAFTFGTDRSKALVRQKGVAHAVADYLTVFNELLKSHGKQMMIWPDFAIQYPELIDMLPRDIVLANWGYGTWDECYEQENHHFALHPRLASRGHPLWACGNNMAEYICTPFQRLEANTQIWIDLGNKYGADGFLITDWGCNRNLHPYVLSLLGDVYVLMKLKYQSLSIDTFLSEFSTVILGTANTDFIRAIKLLCLAQRNADYFDSRTVSFWSPEFTEMLLADPAGESSLARRFGCYTKQGLDRFVADMRKAHGLLDALSGTRAVYGDFLQDLVMLANRVLALALRVRLWYEYTWDTGYMYPQPERDRFIQCLLVEYLNRSAADLKWHEKRWREDNLEGEFSKSKAILREARCAIVAIFRRYLPDDSHVVASLEAECACLTD